MSYKVQIRIDFSQIFNLARYQERNRKELLRLSAERLRRYERQRFIALSAGGNTSIWPALSELRIDQKEGRGVTDKPENILRESDTLLSSINAEYKNDRWVIGFVANTGQAFRLYPSDPVLSIVQLAQYHHKGVGNNPKRPVVGFPPRRVMSQMVKDVKQQYDKFIRANRRKRNVP